MTGPRLTPAEALAAGCRLMEWGEWQQPMTYRPDKFVSIMNVMSDGEAELLLALEKIVQDCEDELKHRGQLPFDLAAAKAAIAKSRGTAS